MPPLSPPPSSAVIAAAGVLNALGTSTSTVSDALDVLGLDGVVPGLGRMSGAGFIAGPAYTLQYEEVSPEAPGTLGDYIDDVPAGAVVVMANGGREDCSVWGDLVSWISLRRGVVGTVIDGACRDLDAIRDSGYSVWARTSCVRTGRNRARLTAIGEPLRIGSVTVAPGDLVCSDASGVVRVRAEDAETVTRGIEEIEEMERRIMEAVEAGRTLAEARAAHGYHQVAKQITGR
ncbi:RraA family protein [Streptomyces sp. ODS05-4]|uniref:RraA family protein n=1 Tax=Streptomyces sp. ODS05-4 TaxID=2944939 RepID=UPI00210D81D2|nr:RraA family protein [Streptomyces sp. ODS05-4]